MHAGQCFYYFRVGRRSRVKAFLWRTVWTVLRLYLIFILPTVIKGSGWNVHVLNYKTKWTWHFHDWKTVMRWIILCGWARYTRCFCVTCQNLWGWIYRGCITCAKKFSWLVHMLSVNTDLFDDGVWLGSDAAAPRESEAEPSAGRRHQGAEAYPPPTLGSSFRDSLASSSTTVCACCRHCVNV